VFSLFCIKLFNLEAFFALDKKITDDLPADTADFIRGYIEQYPEVGILTALIFKHL
jgi:hypothetical protein